MARPRFCCKGPSVQGLCCSTAMALLARAFSCSRSSSIWTGAVKSPKICVGVACMEPDPALMQGPSRIAARRGYSSCISTSLAGLPNSCVGMVNAALEPEPEPTRGLSWIAEDAKGVSNMDCCDMPVRHKAEYKPRSITYHTGVLHMQQISGPTRYHTKALQRQLISGPTIYHRGTLPMQHITGHSYRTSTRRPLLLPIQQLNFIAPEDVENEKWTAVVNYLQKNHPLYEASKEPKVLVLTESFRVLARSLVKLVTCNRKRGYDIWRSIHLANLLVSETSVTFRLEDVSHDLVSDSVPFQGYKVAADMLESLLKAVTNDNDFSHISADVNDLFLKMRAKTPIDKLIYYHAVFLSNSARAVMSVRTQTFLFHDLPFTNVQGKWNRRDWFYICLPDEYTSSVVGNPTDDLHPRFKELRLHAKEFIEVKNEMKSRQQGPEQNAEQKLPQVESSGQRQEELQVQLQPEEGQRPQEQLMSGGHQGQYQQGQQELPPQVQSEEEKLQQEQLASSGHKWLTGKLVVTINRNALMHPKGLQSHAVDQLHAHMPLYLPSVQYLMMYHGMWFQFGMEDLFPENTLGFRWGPMDANLPFGSSPYANSLHNT